MNDIEEVLIDEEIEEVEKRSASYSKYDFPVVTLFHTASNYSIYFNTRAARYVPGRIKWGVTSEYVIGLPAKETDKNSYPVRTCKESFAGKQSYFPSSLRNEKKIRSGQYRLYKYKDGIAFKRYEQLSEEEKK